MCSHRSVRRVYICFGGYNLIMYLTPPNFMRYVGHRELTEEDKRIARQNREAFERCFLPPGVKLKPRSEMRE